jgi:hypothetical protein
MEARQLIDADTHEIVAEELTENDVHDSVEVSPLLKQIRNKVGRF